MKRIIIQYLALIILLFFLNACNSSRSQSNEPEEIGSIIKIDPEPSAIQPEIEQHEKVEPVFQEKKLKEFFVYDLGKFTKTTHSDKANTVGIITYGDDRKSKGIMKFYDKESHLLRWSGYIPIGLHDSIITLDEEKMSGECNWYSKTGELTQRLYLSNITCKTCNGVGRWLDNNELCSQCNGAGKFSDERNYVTEKGVLKRCEYCSGNGQDFQGYKCTFCNGEGIFLDSKVNHEKY